MELALRDEHCFLMMEEEDEGDGEDACSIRKSLTTWILFVNKSCCRQREEKSRRSDGGSHRGGKHLRATKRSEISRESRDCRSVAN